MLVSPPTSRSDGPQARPSPSIWGRLKLPSFLPSSRRRCMPCPFYSHSGALRIQGFACDAQVLRVAYAGSRLEAQFISPCRYGRVAVTSADFGLRPSIGRSHGVHRARRCAAALLMRAQRRMAARKTKTTARGFFTSPPWAVGAMRVTPRPKRAWTSAIGHRFGVTAPTGGGCPAAGGQTHLTCYG